MGVVVVQEQEERLGRAGIQPLQGLGGQVLAVALGRVRREFPPQVEAAAEPPAGLHLGVVDQGRRPVAVTLQDLGQRRDRRRQDGGETLDGVVRGQHRGEQRHVRRQRPGRLGPGLGEADASLGEAVDVRAGVPLVAVAAQVVGPRRVHRDQHHVGPSRGRRQGGGDRPVRGQGLEKGRAEK